MPSPRPPWVWLLDKEWRELMVSRAFWVMLFLTGPLVGVSFISAVDTYAGLSGLGGTAAGEGEAFSPLIGVFGPTFSSYEIVAAFLLPFVAIRMVSADRQSGALKIEIQQPLPPLVRILLKSLVLLAGWLLAGLGAVLSLALWKSYGGAIHWPEIAAIVIGHFLNAGLTIGLAAAAASVTEHPATAAIVTLGFTVGTWVISFVAAVQGGIWERLAAYTPPVMVAAFQHGLIRFDVILAALVLVALGLGLSAVWMKLWAPVSHRLAESMALAGMAALAVAAATLVRGSVDASENRYNSFSVAEEAALSRIHEPLRLEIHLAPEDPRRYDLDRFAISKLRRAMPELTVSYVSATSTGMFEETSAHYGEILYDLGGRKSANRETTAEGVLETIFELAGVTPQGAASEPVFRGHPLAKPPRGAALTFYVLWPALVLGAAFLLIRSPMKPTTSVFTAIALTALLGATAAPAAELRPDLKQDQVGKPPVTFEPMVGTWVVVEDGKDKAVRVDGGAWKASQDSPTKLLAASARRLYGTSNEELMDNAKQFAYFPVAVLKGLDNFSSGEISVKFKTMGGELDRCSGILFNVKESGDWLALRYNDTENNVVLWEFHNGLRRPVRFSDREKKFMLDRAAWHELKVMVEGAQIKGYLDGQLALEYTMGSEPGPGRNGAPPNPDLFPANNPVLRPPVAGKVGLWSKTDSVSQFKDFAVAQKP